MHAGVWMHDAWLCSIVCLNSHASGAGWRGCAGLVFAKQQVWAGLRVCVLYAIFPWTCQAFRHAACSFACACLHNRSQRLRIRLHKTPSFFAGLCALQACFCCCKIERIACCRNACPLLPVLQAVRWCHRLDPRLSCKMMDCTNTGCGSRSPS